MSKRRYDYVWAAKTAAHNEDTINGWCGMTVKKVLRKLVREAVMEAQTVEWEDTRPGKINRQADRIAKELVP